MTQHQSIEEAIFETYIGKSVFGGQMVLSPEDAIAAIDDLEMAGILVKGVDCWRSFYVRSQEINGETRWQFVASYGTPLDESLKNDLELRVNEDGRYFTASDDILNSTTAVKDSAVLARAYISNELPDDVTHVSIDTGVGGVFY